MTGNLTLLLVGELTAQQEQEQHREGKVEKNQKIYILAHK